MCFQLCVTGGAGMHLPMIEETECRSSKFFMWGFLTYYKTDFFHKESSSDIYLRNVNYTSKTYIYWDQRHLSCTTLIFEIPVYLTLWKISTVPWEKGCPTPMTTSPKEYILYHNGRLARVFLTLLDTELKRTDVISGWNPSLVGAGRAEPKGTEWSRMEPSGANRETGEGDERAIYPVRRHVPTGGQNSRKSSITNVSILIIGVYS